MLVGAAVCSGAPFQIPGMAPALAAGVPALHEATRVVIDRLTGADRVVAVVSDGRMRSPDIAAPGPGVIPRDREQGRRGGWRIVPSGTALRATVGRSDAAEVSTIVLPRLRAGAPASPKGGLAVGSLVAAQLLAACLDAPTSCAVEFSADPAPDLFDRLDVAGIDRVGLLVIADGSACHGSDAPGQPDAEAEPFDRRVCDALERGDSAELARACTHPSAERLLTGVGALRVLARCAATLPSPRARLLYYGAPFGVGYFVAYWAWDDHGAP